MHNMPTSESFPTYDNQSLACVCMRTVGNGREKRWSSLCAAGLRPEDQEFGNQVGFGVWYTGYVYKIQDLAIRIRDSGLKGRDADAGLEMREQGCGMQKQGFGSSYWLGLEFDLRLRFRGIGLSFRVQGKELGICFRDSGLNISLVLQFRIRDPSFCAPHFQRSVRGPLTSTFFL